VQGAGGLGIVLPPDPAVVEDPDLLLDRVDGLILAGGADVDPATYGAEAEAETTGTWPERDRFELALTRRALEREMPVLGICRGMQLLNVALGGTLVQHLPDALGSEAHRTLAGTFGEHEVRLEPGTLARRAAGAERLAVKSHHHQGVEKVGEGLLVSGRAVGDDLAEAIELPEHRFALGVLWHPEEDPGSTVIAALVEEASA
jgi:putative glutamine amidotransferase